MRALQVRSLFNWPWGKKEEKKGEFADILKSARTMKRGCELAPKEAPEGLKLATFAGACFGAWSTHGLLPRAMGSGRHADAPCIHAHAGDHHTARVYLVLDSAKLHSRFM